MADEAISVLAALTALAEDDEFVAVDTDQVETKRITVPHARQAIMAFPATAVPSADPNTLDDYQEGTYTATLTCGTSGTITLDASFDNLAYTKIGRSNTVIGLIKVDSVSSPVGSLSVNIPFDMAALAGTTERFAGSVTYNGVNAIGVAGALSLYATATDAVNIIEQSTTTAVDDVANHMKISSILIFGFTYFADFTD